MNRARRERKVVTVLFADLVGFTSRAESLDPEDVEAILGPYHERLRLELERHGGTVEKFIGDAVMALFGAPTAHEDDPERAVRAALAIRDWAEEEGELEVRIGITTGEALVSLDARPEAGQGMASGDVVNTAARLQARAPVNGILVDETTYRATRQEIEYEPSSAVAAKGKTGSISVWRAANARSVVEVDLRPGTRLIGRLRERDLLLDAFERVRREASPQLVTLVGVPGIGKSRLVAELYAEIERDPELIHWRQGRSLPYGEGISFWAFAEIVEAEAGILQGDSADVARAKLHRAVDAAVEPDDAEWIKARLEPLIGLGERAQNLEESFAAWRRFVEALAEERPTVLVFEDLHWASDDLLDLVDHLVDWAAGVPLLVVGTARPELLDRRPGWGGGKRNAITISLAPLDDVETAELLSVLLDRPVLPAGTQELLLQRAGGNPLYAEQFVRMVAERGDESGLPETVQGIIAARLDALPAAEKALLQDASVVGKLFWTGSLHAVSGIDLREAERLLHGLERKEFVRRERRSSVAGEAEYAFAHVLIRDVAYGQIPRAARAERHRAVAEWFELSGAEDRAELLAHHYLSALQLGQAAGLDVSGLVEPARDALIEAGDHAMALSSYVPARRFYRAALELEPKPGSVRGHLLLRWARSLTGVLSDEGLDALREAIPMLLGAEDTQAAAEAEATLANGLWVRGDRISADEHAARAAELVAGEPPTPTTLTVLAERSRLLLVGGQADEAIAVAREGVEGARALGREDVHAMLLVTIGAARSLLGDFGGVADLEEGLRIAESLKLPATLQRAYANLAEAYWRMGRRADGTAMFAAGRASNERYGHASGLAFALGDEAFDCYCVGAWDAALRKSEELLEIAEAGSGHYHESTCRIITATILLARNEVAAALDESARAAERARPSDPQIRSPVLALRALILMSADDPDADAVAQEALVVPLEYSAAVPLAFVLAELGRPEALRPLLYGLGARAWAEAAGAVLDGSFVEAADHLAEMGDAADEAYARLRSGRDDQIRRAVEFYRSVGATRYIREGEALLAATA
jgi:class 3 adenylate cyclase/tetratricopeptide (TPR) repeat protein